MSAATDGVFAFLFTDIEGSTRLWAERTAMMRAALAQHDTILREIIATHRGVVFKTIGDAFCAAFSSPHAAAEAAVAAQRALRSAVPMLRVRMALHVGEAEARDGDYFGPALNHVARLLAAGHGGQILTSLSMARALESALPTDVRLHPLGRHQLRDIPLRDSISQLQPQDLPDRFPRLNTVNVARRQGATRAFALSTLVVAVVATLAVLAYKSSIRERAQRRATLRLLYASDMSAAKQALDDHMPGRARALLEPYFPISGEEDLRTFEWRHLWRTCAGQSVYTSPVHWSLPAGLAISPDGKWLVVGCFDGTLTLRRTEDHSVVSTAQLTGGWIRALQFAPDGKSLLSWSIEGVYRLLRLPDLAILSTRSDARADMLTYATDRRLFATYTAPEAYIEQLDRVAPGEGPICKLPRATSIAVSSDGSWAAAIDKSGLVETWRLVSAGAKLTAVRVAGRRFSPGDAVAELAPDGSSLVLDRPGKPAAVWDRQLGRCLFSSSESANLQCARYSPDGRSVAIGDVGGTITYVSLDTGRAKALRGHGASVYQVAFAPDGYTLASTSEDGTYKLWDTHPAGR